MSIRDKSKNKIRTSLSISPEFYKLAIENNIKFSEAISVGISMILAEKGYSKYDNRINRLRKLKYLMEMEKVIEKLIEVEDSENANKQIPKS